MYNTIHDQRWKSSTLNWNNSSTSSVKNEEITTSKWHTWAQEEDKHNKTSVESHSPKISHMSIKSPIVQHNEHKTFTIQPNEDSFLLVTSDPPLCFCKKPAHKSYTLEYGPILECASYNLDINEDKVQSLKSKYTCGFHVHERSWIKIREVFLNGQTIDAEYSELKSCPMYNFTYCSIFFVTNKYNKVPPLVLPHCFCGKSVILRDTSRGYADHRPRYLFSCPNSLVEGHKKCSWRLEVNEVAFPRSNKRIHDRVSLEEYNNQFSSQQQSKKQHQNELLATLSSTKNVIDFESLKEKLTSSSSSSSSLLVPTSVLVKKQQPSLSSSTSTTSSSVTSPKLNEIEEVKSQNKHLIKTMERIKKEFQCRILKVNQELEETLDKLTQVQLDCKEELSDMSLDLREETILRENCQNKLAHNEIKLVKLVMDKDTLAEEYLNYREEIKLKYGKEEERNKCKVCFHRTIEYVLIPCYHYAYCHPCAIKLKECAICRRPFHGIQKIYSC